MNEPEMGVSPVNMTLMEKVMAVPAPPPPDVLLVDVDVEVVDPAVDVDVVVVDPAVLVSPPELHAATSNEAIVSSPMPSDRAVSPLPMSRLLAELASARHRKRVRPVVRDPEPFVPWSEVTRVTQRVHGRDLVQHFR